MTRSLSLCLEDLDCLAAQKILGFTQMPDLEIIHGRCFVRRDLWEPTRDIAQAWELVGVLLAQDIDFSIDAFLSRDTKVKTYHVRTDNVNLEICPSAAEAIVRSCLKAKGVEID